MIQAVRMGNLHVYVWDLLLTISASVLAFKLGILSLFSARFVVSSLPPYPTVRMGKLDVWDSLLTISASVLAFKLVSLFSATFCTFCGSC